MKIFIAAVLVILTLVFVASVFRQTDDTASPVHGYAGGSPRLAELLSDQGQEGFAKAIEPGEFIFPADHGPHPQFRNEWWYFTGNLDGERDERFGFELTIFRFTLTPRQQEGLNGSAWRSNQVFIGHFAITDVANAGFHVAERYARGALGLAGAQADPLRIWVEDWSIVFDDGRWRVRAEDEEIAIDLVLKPLKSPVLNGVDGLSQKSAEAGNASYYYSIPRLATTGKLRTGNEEFSVSGLSWLDREWSSSSLSGDQQGWDWFALQLSDGSELMFYSLRRNDGSRDPHSAGTWIMADGSSAYLNNEEVEIVVEEYWHSPLGGTYPMGWRLRIPRADVELTARPVLDAQELRTMVRYWEGAVDVAGQKSGKPIDGRGYVELTGYAERPRSSLR